MKITNNTSTILYIKNVAINPGCYKYRLDHKDPGTASQLRVLRDDMGFIEFGEILEGDNDGRVIKTVKAPPQPRIASAGGRAVHRKKSTDKSQPRGKVAKRRDSDNKPGKLGKKD